MEGLVIEEHDILKEYGNILEEYDIGTIEIENDPDLKRMEEIMKKLKEGD